MKNKTKRTLTPKLRFPEFRAKREWENLVFSDLYNFKPTNTFSRDKLNYETGTIRNIHYGDIHTRFQALFDVRKEIVPFVTPTDALSDFRESAFCTEGDMVFADASEDLADVGKSIEIIALHGERVLSGTHTILATRKDTQLIAGFGGHLFRSDFIRSQIRKEAQGSKVFGISPGHLANIEVCFPADKTEQQKIADCLSSLDGLIDGEGRKLEALRAHKKGLMQNLFPRPGETIPRLRFPEFQNAGEWEEATIGANCKSFSGGTPSTGRKDYYGGTIPFIRSAEIGRDKTELFLSAAGLKNSAAKMVRKGDVLVALYGANSGDVELAQVDGAINQAILCLRPNGSAAFLFHFLTERKEWVIRTYLQGGQGNLSGEIVKSITVAWPREQEQQRIATCLSSIDDLITDQSLKLEALQTHKKGLMQQLFPSQEEVEA